MSWRNDYECGTCGKTFPAGWRARDNHCRSTGHSAPRFECDTCSRCFRSQSACNQHMNDTNHWPCECNICYETWPTDEERADHEVRDHYYCSPCARDFQSYNGIKMHLTSRIHRSQDIECPFCTSRYATATGVTHHLESGACVGARGLNRDEIYRFVRSKDPSGVISKNLIGWTGSTEYEANGLSWNGNAYECYLCHRGFRQLSSLNQHLNSPTHQQELYHCPKFDCRTSFKSLAAIINHLESEACGCTRFEKIQSQIGTLLSGNRLIAF